MPSSYSSGQNYVINSNLRSLFQWGTDLEVLALVQITGHDIYIYSQHKQWVRYSPNMKQTDPKTTAFYLNNHSGAHFDPVLTSLKW